MSQINKQMSIELKHSRIAIFAAYSPNGVITKELLYYLEQLNKIVDGVIFIADNDFSVNELKKIENFVIYADCEHHGKYDFGSYSKGLYWLKNSEIWGKFNELLICNDSVLGPYRSLDFFLEEKEKAGNPPFFGCTINNIGLGKLFPHIQSYFFTLHKSVFLSEFFTEFFAKVQKEKNKTEIVKKYEIGFSELMKQHKIKYDAIYSKSVYCDPCREFIEHFDEMLFIKKNRFKYYHTYKVNNMLKKIKFPYMIINGSFVDRTIMNSMKSFLYLLFEPARLIRETDFYKKRKYLRKIAKFN